jgi:hypothetical protein
MGLQVWMQSLAESTTTNKLHDEGDVDVHRQREHGLLPTAVTVHIRQSDRRLSRDDDRLRAKCPRRRLLGASASWRRCCDHRRAAAGRPCPSRPPRKVREATASIASGARRFREAALPARPDRRQYVLDMFFSILYIHVTVTSNVELK